ncbi:hypothetical protein KP509_21G010300 [Ceratopteris richardii]|nr:hypothetical protein KP509_21G010300 [Ceratopteris richardii]
MGSHETDPIICSALVDMYSKCYHLSMACQVFEKSIVRDAVLWTTLIAGCVECGRAAESLRFFELMTMEDVIPDAVAYACCLKACIRLGAIDEGLKFHDELQQRGFLERGNNFLGSILVDMYAKGGLVFDARHVFESLSSCDIVTWNTLMQGYVTLGQGDEALQILDKMLDQGVVPDAVTYACSLKACAILKALDRGQCIYAEIERKGLIQNDRVLGNCVVNMYVKCGFLSRAHAVLDKLPFWNIVSWTAIIDGYGEHGYFKEALECFQQMQSEGIHPNIVTFICILKICSSVREVDKGRDIHAEIERSSMLENDVNVGNALLDMYFKCGVLVQAQQVFDCLVHRNVVSWNTMIAGYADNEHGLEALKNFHQMLSEGFLPDAVTFASSLKACGNVGILCKGYEIHAQIEAAGLLTRDNFVCSTLVDLYAKFGLLGHAQEVFDKLRFKDLVAWNALITGYSDHGCAEDALECFEKLQAEPVSPNAITYVCCMKACGMVGALDVGREIHSELARMCLLHKDSLVGNTLVDMYAKCGSLKEADEVLLDLGHADIAAWNALMGGYTNFGQTLNALHLFNRMVGEGIDPDSITFLIALSACSHAGLFISGDTFFESMSKEFGIIPSFKHYGCIVHHWSQIGKLDEAVAQMRNIPHSSSLVAWYTVLSACQTLGNIELGKEVFQEVVSFGSKSTSKTQAEDICSPA